MLYRPVHDQCVPAARVYNINRVCHGRTVRKTMIVLFWDRESIFFITHPYLTLPKQPKNGAIFGVIYPWLSKTKPKIKNRPNSPDVAFYYLSIRIFGEAYKSKLTFTAHPPFSCTSFRTLHQVSCKYYIFSIVAPSRY